MENPINSHATTGHRASRVPPIAQYRKFDPLLLYGSDIDSTAYENSSLNLAPSPAGNYTFVPCSAYPPCTCCAKRPFHTNSLIVAIDGMCTRRHTCIIQSALGVYFASTSSWNVSVLRDDPFATTELSVLRTVIAALINVSRIKEEDMPVLRSVVVKTHSKFLVRGMTEEVIRWRQNGWINCNGVKTCNWQYYAEIDDRIEDLRRRGVNVAFWLVEKEQNEEARALAIDAIERVGMSLWNGVQRVKNCECD